MNAEKIMDALNLLDDDLIGEVDALRNKKAPKKPTPWRKILPVAACFGLVLTAVLVWSRLDTTPDGAVSENAQVEMMGSVPENDVEGTIENGGGQEYVSDENLADDGMQSIPETEIESTPGSDGYTDGYPPETDEVPSVILQIDVLEDGGFQGTVVEIVDTDFFSVGMEVTVEFMDDAFIGEISEGDRVLVMFNGFDDNTLYAEYVGRTTE
jgi:hypothetical protein